VRKLEPDLIRKVCDISGSCRAEAPGKKASGRGEPAGVPDQQTFIDLAEDRDCARGVFIVIRGGMSGMPIPRGAGSAREFMGAFQ